MRTVPTRQSKCLLFTEMRLSLEPEAISCESRAMATMECPVLGWTLPTPDTSSAFDPGAEVVAAGGLPSCATVFL
jgi:hypothetical protein